MFKRGDLLLFDTDKEGSTGHSAIAVSSTEIVHASVLDGVCKEGAKDAGLSNPLVFRMTDEAVAERAAALAIQWAGKKTVFSSSTDIFSPGKHGDKVIEVSEARVIGPTEAGKNPHILEFDYDALYRIFKWAANNGDKPFSANRGTTCAAFVTAVFQTARVCVVVPRTAVLEAFAYLAQNRQNKLPKEERIGTVHIVTKSGKYLGRRAFPEFTNPGGKVNVTTAFEEIAKLSTAYGGQKLAHPHQLTTVALFADAKFAVTKVLLERLRKDQVFWCPVL